MGVNAKLFWILSAFFTLLAVVYTVWTLLYGAQDVAQDPGAGGTTGAVIEWAGSLGLLLAGAASALIAFIAAGFVVIALVGWVFEYYRGNFAH